MIKSNEALLIKEKHPKVFDLLLIDHSTKKNLIWGTDNYSFRGLGYQRTDAIIENCIFTKSNSIIKPRVQKSQREQKKRSKDMAEVFTPSWICNFQNNQIDEAWFGFKGAFNTESNEGWTSSERVLFPEGKTWQNYVLEIRLEIACGEAPYLANRYDAASGEEIPIRKRVGLLDRKLRVISENTKDEKDWQKWAVKAVQSVYGYDFQGDNVLLARENLFLDVMEHFKDKFDHEENDEFAVTIAEILSWNIFQMDGTKFVVPYSCHKDTKIQGKIDFETGELYYPEPKECPGCKASNNLGHNGIYVYIKDWKKNKRVRFLDVSLGRS